MKLSNFWTFLENMNEAKALEDELFAIVQKHVRNGLPRDLVLEPVETLLDRMVLELCEGTTKDLKDLYESHLYGLDIFYETEVENNDKLSND